MSKLRIVNPPTPTDDEHTGNVATQESQGGSPQGLVPKVSPWAAARPASPASTTPFRPIAVLVPSRNDQHLAALLNSMEMSQPGSTTSVYVGDNGVSPEFRAKWPQITWVPVSKPFVFAKAINNLARLARMGGAGQAKEPMPDLLVLNDDTEIATVNWLTMCQALLASDAAQPYGMISLQIAGGVGNPEQKVSGLGPLDIKLAAKTICFVACLIPHEVWETIGLLDEDFLGYGFDDDDYCERVRQAGFLCGVSGAATVKHGFGNQTHSSSFVPVLGYWEWLRAADFNGRVFARKYRKPIGIRIERHCLNIGCGDHPRVSNPLDSWLNLDVQPLPGVDIVRDLKRGLPFDDASFDYILADNVLEHVEPDDVVFMINEIDRVLRVGGLAEIIVPHSLIGQGAYQDPTHKTYFVPRSVLYWNQVMSLRGGIFCGITANLVPYPDMDGGIIIHGDPTNTEVFIRFFLQKQALPEAMTQP